MKKKTQAKKLRKVLKMVIGNPNNKTSLPKSFKIENKSVFLPTLVTTSVQTFHVPSVNKATYLVIIYNPYS